MSKSKSVSLLTGLPTHCHCRPHIALKKTKKTINYIKWEEIRTPLPHISPTAHSAAPIPFALISMFLNLEYKVAPIQPPAIETQLWIYRLHSRNKCVRNYRGETQRQFRLSEIRVHVLTGVFFPAGCRYSRVLRSASASGNKDNRESGSRLHRPDNHVAEEMYGILKHHFRKKKTSAVKQLVCVSNTPACSEENQDALNKT